ncbi:hypothetical protein [Lactobacillus sp. ESL0233]|uniref:hypothetical protein n=1 Tax=Lactobacillus sp. ESL0233 TaxID=2069354 RepID=UPI0013146E19|nr:hypothetical protein [Lactobacillus sp. ESL0233]
MKKVNFLNHVAIRIAIATMAGNYKEVLQQRNILNHFIDRLIFEAEIERDKY